jgi:hypothetical protein
MIIQFISVYTIIIIIPSSHSINAIGPAPHSKAYTPKAQAINASNPAAPVAALI